MSQKTFSKPLFEVMQEYSPVYPSSHKWADTINVLLEDDLEVIEELKRQYLKDGSFRDAVVLEEADEDDPEDMAIIADGTHRVVVAYLLGADEITVSNEYPDFEDKGFCLVTKIVPADEDFDDDDYDEIVEKLRSFAISDDLWLTSSLASSGPDGLEIYWDEDDLNLIPIINDKFIELAGKFIEVNEFAITTYASVWEDPHDKDYDQVEDHNEN